MGSSISSTRKTQFHPASPRLCRPELGPHPDFCGEDMTDDQVGLTDPQVADWRPSCPNCVAAPRLTHSILDSRRGTTVRLYHCSECGNRLWDDGPGGLTAATKGPDSSAAVRLTVAPEALSPEVIHGSQLGRSQDQKDFRNCRAEAGGANQAAIA